MKIGNCFKSKLGDIFVESEGDKIVRVGFGFNKYSESSTVVEECIKELKEYFAKERKDFDIPCKITGRSFTLKVLNALRDIQYGQVVTYKELAKRAGNEKASRAVGQIMHNNKIALIYPCHRVIGSNNNLTGFNGGIDKKKILLEMENGL